MNFSNNLSSLLPTFFFAAQQIQREKTALIESVTVNADVAQIAKGMTATFPIAPPAQLYDVTPGTLPTINGETAGVGTLAITDSQAGAFVYTGEEQRQLAIGGIYNNHYLNQIMERMRSIRNAVEKSLSGAAQLASRAIGTAGTAPFAVNLAANPTVTGMEPFAAINKEMTDTGSPGIGRGLALGSTAGAKLRNVPNLYRANEAGDNRMLRTGEIGVIEGFACSESGQIKPVAACGTGSGYQFVGAHAKGSTTITVDTGSGTILKGDIFSLASSVGRQYVATSALSGGILTIARPGLMDDCPDNDALTLNTTVFTPNLAMTKDAIHLVARHPLLPGVGGQASGNGGAGGILLDTANIPDPGTGLIYQVCMWSMYRQIMIELALSWGYAVVNPQDLYVLLG